MDKNVNFYFAFKEAENVFKERCRQDGYAVVRSNKQQDMFDHVDFFLTKGGETFSVDFKAAKKKNRRDAEVDYDLIWIELTNVRGDKGWLYGKADYIVFEIESEYIFVDRIDLIEFTKARVVSKINRTKKKETFYQRKNREDIVYWTTLNDILEFFSKKEYFRLSKLEK